MCKVSESEELWVSRCVSLVSTSDHLGNRGPVINHGNAGNQTKGPASATISKESGGLPHGKPREAPRKLRKIPRKFREFWWNFWVSSSVRRALFQARLVM